MTSSSNPKTQKIPNETLKIQTSHLLHQLSFKINVIAYLFPTKSTLGWCLLSISTPKSTSIPNQPQFIVREGINRGIQKSSSSRIGDNILVNECEERNEGLRNGKKKVVMSKGEQEIESMVLKELDADSGNSLNSSL